MDEPRIVVQCGQEDIQEIVRLAEYAKIHGPSSVDIDALPTNLKTAIAVAGICIDNSIPYQLVKNVKEATIWEVPGIDGFTVKFKLSTDNFDSALEFRATMKFQEELNRLKDTTN